MTSSGEIKPRVSATGGYSKLKQSAKIAYLGYEYQVTKHECQSYQA